MNINFLKAFNGDCIHIAWMDTGGVQKNMLIDGGIGKTYSEKGKKKTQYNELYHLINTISGNNENIDLLVLTHVDDDHIGGLLKWFRADPVALNLVKKVWFNSGRLITAKYGSTDSRTDEDYGLDFDNDDSLETSIKQGVKFEDILDQKPGIWHKEIIHSGLEFMEGGLNIKILSPDEDKLRLLLGKWEREIPDSMKTSMGENDYHITLKKLISEADPWEEDKAIHNGSSIAFSITYNHKYFLFLGDAHPSVFNYWLHYFYHTKNVPIQFELVKLSHHGSQFNNNVEFLDLVTANHYVISTNSQKHSHPHKRFIARLIKNKITPVIYFNYPELIDQIFLPEDFADFPFLRSLDRNNPILNFS